MRNVNKPVAKCLLLLAIQKITMHNISVVTGDFLLGRYLWLTMVKNQIMVLGQLNLSPCSGLVPPVTLNYLEQDSYSNCDFY